MANKLSTKTTALALAATSAVAYVVCVLLILLLGSTGVSLFAKMFHGIDITKIATTSISLTDTIIGFVVLVVSALLVGALFAKLYNIFEKSE